MDYFAGTALLPDGWKRNVLIRSSEHGDITDVICDAAPEGAVHLGNAVLPGIPNVHSHAHQRAVAGLAERRGSPEDDFWSWREVMYRYVDLLSPDDLQAIAAEAFLEMLRSGYTTVGEFHYVHHSPNGERYRSLAEMSQRIDHAARDAGIGITHLPVLYRYGGFREQEPSPSQRRFVCEFDEFLEIHSSLATLTAQNPNASLGVAPHSLRAVSPALLSALVQHVGQHFPRAPIHLHIAEQESEVDECVKVNGERPVEWLLDHCPPDERFCLVHATHVTTEEMARIARSRAVVGICPTTEANLGDGFFPAVAYTELGGALAIGSDSNVSRCPATELCLLEYGQRLLHRRRNLLARVPERSTGRELVNLALAGGARALGRRIGRLQSGYRADLLALDTEHPSLAARSEDALLDTWIFAHDAGLVRHVVVGGHWLIRDRRHAHEERIQRDFKRTLERLQAST